MIVTVQRFRFAPRADDLPDVPNLHLALFNWALARGMSGDFIVRIDAADPEQTTGGAAQEVLDALTWMGVDWDEGPDVGGESGPYNQSERGAQYERLIQQLLDSDHLYATEESERTLRLRLPRDGQTVVEDALRGPFVFENRDLEDTILVRDGTPLPLLTAALDDHLMGITHVVRDEASLPQAPIQILIYQALGWPEPVWVHLPLILDEAGDALLPGETDDPYLIDHFQTLGYLPEALFSYLLSLGWTPDSGQAIISRWDVRQQFQLQRLSTVPPVFSWSRLDEVNRHAMQSYSDPDLAALLRPFLEEAYGGLPASEAWLIRLTGIVRHEIARLADVVAVATWAFVDPDDYTDQARRQLSGEMAHRVLVHLVADIAQVVVLDEPTAQSILDSLSNRFTAQFGGDAEQIFLPLRAALTGATNTLPLPEMMALLGKERCLTRLAAVLRRPDLFAG